ncbi:hypothetical protein A3649_07040 [Mycobacterium ulcerans]|nr:hypothetical protein A3649_07040 [Mycobacterium ulcerans]
MSHEFGYRRRPGVLREVGAAGTQHPGNLTPPHGDGMATDHQVERFIGERQRRLIARCDHHHAARAQPLGG